MEMKKAVHEDRPEEPSDKNFTTVTDGGQDFLDPPVTPEGKRAPREPMTPEALERIVRALPKELSLEHKEILQSGSCINAEVIQRSGYFSVSTSAIRQFGFPESHGPALAMPYRNRDGRIVQVDLRFDRPAPDPEKSGKSTRYRSPWGLPKSLDWPDPLPDDASESVFFVEGKKKTDSLRSRGLYAVALPGIFGLGFNAKEARRDVEAVEWTGREVIVVFDTETKPKTRATVEKARTALCSYLASLGAIPKIVKLPEPDDGMGKTGVDDWIAGGGTRDQLFGLIEDAPPDWKSEIVLSETGAVRVNTFNLGLIICNDPEFDVIRKTRFNELTKRLELPDGTPIETPKLTEIAVAIEGSYRTSLIQIDALQRVIELVGTKCSCHPIREWLGQLPPWDKQPRVERLFIDYYGSINNEYHRAVGRNLMIASVARIMRPGCKFDSCVVLEGDQGILKSSSIPTLFGSEWSTTARSDIHNKDFIAGLLGFWAVEIAELASLRKSDVEAIKSVLSATSDDIRLAYRRDVRRYPRQCVLIATTNEKEYLLDSTGNRRFWPVKCSRIDLGGLKRDRNQLWAEALSLFQSGELWWIMPETVKVEQETRYLVDAWEERIAPWLSVRVPQQVTVSEVLEDCVGLPLDRQHRTEQTRCGQILRRLNWIPTRVRSGEGRIRIYHPAQPEPENGGCPEVGPEVAGGSSIGLVQPSQPKEAIGYIEGIYNIGPHDKNKKKPCRELYGKSVVQGCPGWPTTPDPDLPVEDIDL